MTALNTTYTVDTINIIENKIDDLTDEVKYLKLSLEVINGNLNLITNYLIKVFQVPFDN